MVSGEQAVVRYLSENKGVISRDEAIAMGMAPATITRRVRDGHLVLASRGLYVLPGVVEHERTLIRAAAHALNAVVSHESAARLHGLDGTDPRIAAVTVPIRRSNKFADVRVHQSTDLSVDETVYIADLPVTDPPRTIIDLAAVLPERILATVTDQSVRMRLTSYDALSMRLEATARKGKPGVRKLRSLLENRSDSTFVTESELEVRLLRILKRVEIQPDLQFKAPWLRHVDGRVDFAYPDQRVVVEGDSLRWHGSPEAFQLDRYRDNLGQMAGWVVLRFTWGDITKRPDYVVHTVRNVLMKRSNDQI